MLLEFDADQRLWQETVRDAVAKQCPPSLVRGVAEEGVDPTPLWKTYVDAGWTELTDAENAVELAIVLEELGRATDPTPFLATLTQFAPLAGDHFDPQRAGTAVYSGVSARRDADGWVLDGTARHVLDGDRAERVAVVTDAGVFVVDAGHAVARRSQVFDPVLHIAEVSFDGVQVPDADRVHVDPEKARHVALAGLAITTVGACQRILDLVLEHVKQRQQFGVAIGSFQAVQHKAVDMHVATERARALSYFAALTISADDPRRRQGNARHSCSGTACSCSAPWGSPGRMTCSSRSSVPRPANCCSAQRPSTARSSRRNSMQLTFDSDVEEFRAEFSAFLDEHLPSQTQTLQRPRSVSHMPQWARHWQRLLFDNGWLLPAQPPEFGGRNATVLQQFVHLDELCRRRIYHSFNPQGVNIIAASLLSFGSDEQKHRWAVPVLKAELTASLGMSEPSAGSDLASLRTRAVLDGDHFVVNGQKVWTSGAHDADFLLTFVRTDPDAPKHKGISALIIPTATPGVVCRPFADMCGQHNKDFNEVFFTDARVPAENLVGPLNGGWGVANGSLGHERTMMWLGFADRIDNMIADFRPRTELERDQYATTIMDYQALRAMGSAALARAARGEADTASVSVLKLFGSEAERQAFEHALTAAGPDGLTHPSTTGPYAHMNLDHYFASWFERYARSFGGTIAGGTSEIQRNIIATQVLGLPRR